MKKAPFKENKIFADLHAHLPKPKNKKQLTAILNELTSGIIGVTKALSDSRVLTYEELLDFKDDNFIIKEIEKDILAEITQKDKIGYAINTQEVLENISKPHILAIGCKDYISDNLPPKKVIKEIKKQNGLSIINHAYITSSRDIFRYRLITSEEEKEIKDLCYLVDEIEVCNGQCIDLAFGFDILFLKRLNMKKANILARELIKQYNKKGIAASDTHFELDQIKTSGIYLPFESSNYILESLAYNLKTGNFESYAQPVSGISFLKGMFLH
jgi:hypothetical protein